MDPSTVALAGHAEDPDADFRPSPGKIERMTLPEGIRVDTHVVAGYTVPPHYDSLIAKLIAFDADRPSCIAKLRGALAELEVEGTRTTKTVHQRILESDPFLRGEYDTRTVAELGGV